ncbi:MAG: aspartate/glutamate racemase family protein [Deltaproteobacteria bacterium]|nr:aspartate/glutamate racemase family protein [Deltaproteobacteria bacterium]
MPASGAATDGATIGIIMLDTVFPRIPGDIGNPGTFDFPVRYQVVRGASPQRVVKEADPRLLEPFIDAARGLEKEGVKAIATSCGFLAIFQRELADAVKIPVLSSSLLQVPLAYALINRRQKVGVLTARAQSLTDRHLAGVGIRDIPLIIMGMEEAEEFTGAFIEGKPSLDPEKVRKEMVGAAQRLVHAHPEIGALVLECTNMPPYAQSVQAVMKIPVFDVVTLVRLVHASLERQTFGKNPLGDV